MSPQERQKQHGRAAAQRRAAAAAARAEAQARQRKLRIIVIGVVLILAVLGGLLASIAGGGDDDGVAATTTTIPTPTTAVEGDLVEPTCPTEGEPAERPAGFTSAPPTCIEDGVDYRAVMTTSEGEIAFDLLEELAPNTVNNFVFLARWGWYDGDDFHRVVPGFMNQGGDPISDGNGDPGYEFADELPIGVEAYVPGAVAMANSGPNTNGSQFFICVGCQTALGQAAYSLFGQVTEGMEVVEAINALGVGDGPPSRPVTIESVTILEA